MGALEQNIYEDGSYLANNPTWHEEDAPFKAKYVAQLLTRNAVAFKSVAEIGCGTGAVLKQLAGLTGRGDVVWKGFDIAPAAIAMAQRQISPNMTFVEQDLLETDEQFDVLLIIDVIEHIPDYMSFARRCAQKARYKIYHIPLDLHVSAILRDSLLHGRDTVGHLHYFTQSTALATLRDTGHKVIDSVLTPGALETAALHPSLKISIANVPRTIVGSVSPAWSSRLFGGYSLMVLAE